MRKESSYAETGCLGHSAGCQDGSLNFPSLTRRDFLRLGSLGITGYSLLPILQPHNVQANAKVQPRGGAEVCIFLFLAGGPSQLDTFDVKEGNWTPQDFDIQTIRQGLRMPVGLLPELSRRTDKFSIVRSLEAWEAEHNRGMYYVQAGRILSPARLREIPSFGSVVAYESLQQRKESDFLPPFISIDMPTQFLIGNGMLSPEAAPMAMFSNAPPPFVLPESQRASFERRARLLKQLKPEEYSRGQLFGNLEQYYQSAYPLLNDPQSARIFNLDPSEKSRYGNSGVGNACAIARNIIEAGAGTKFIFISQPGWDLHADCYAGSADDKSKGQYKVCAQLDAALSSLLDDLEEKTDQDGRRLIDKTFIAAMGEFGRTPGNPTVNKGRDHYRYAGVGLFAGAGVKSKVLGATDEIGGKVVDTGWHKRRSIYPEDIIVTMYSALGIDWMKTITQTPTGRPFEYIESISPKGRMEFTEISPLFS